MAGFVSFSASILSLGNDDHSVSEDDDSYNCNCNRDYDDDDDKDWMAWPVSSVSLPLASPCKEEVSSPPTTCCRCKMMNVMMMMMITVMLMEMKMISGGLVDNGHDYGNDDYDY